MNKITMVGLLFTVLGTSASGDVRTDFVLAQVEPLPPANYIHTGSDHSSTSKTVIDVTYWVQPCAKQRFDQFVVTNSIDPDGFRQIRVGVLIYDSGIMCKGPTVQKTKTLTLEDAFNSTGEPPKVKRLKSLSGNL